MEPHQHQQQDAHSRHATLQYPLPRPQALQHARATYLPQHQHLHAAARSGPQAPQPGQSVAQAPRPSHQPQHSHPQHQTQDARSHSATLQYPLPRPQAAPSVDSPPQHPHQRPISTARPGPQAPPPGRSGPRVPRRFPSPRCCQPRRRRLDVHGQLEDSRSRRSRIQRPPSWPQRQRPRLRPWLEVQQPPAGQARPFRRPSPLRRQAHRPYPSLISGSLAPGPESKMIQYESVQHRRVPAEAPHQPPPWQR